MHLSAWWLQKEAEFWDRVAVRGNGQSATYSSLNQIIEAQAQQLQSWGIQPGMKVVLLCLNRPNFLGIFLAVLRAGAIPCPLNPNMSVHELDQVLKLLAPDLVILASEISETDAYQQVLGAYALLSEWTLVQPSPLPIFSTPSLNQELPDKALPDQELEDVACILCTSGTTGIPKAVMLTHDNLLSNVAALRANKQWHPQEVFGNALPTFHIYGLTVLTLLPLALGATVVYLPPFTPQSCLQTIQTLDITCFGGVPSMFTLLNKYNHRHQHDVSCCRAWVSGGAPLSAATVSEFADKYDGALIYEGYGMLEASPGISWNLNDDAYHPGSVGRPLQGVQVEIRNAQGSPLPQGETGHIWVKSPGVMKGYYRNLEATQETLHQDWLASGDLGCFDADGYLYLMGREKQVMLVGGHNVYPREVETVLLTSQSVVDAAVVSRPHSTRGEEILAFVVPTPGSSLEIEHLQQLCREQLSAYKRPKQFVITDQIARNDSGKVLRKKLLQTSEPQMLQSV